MATTITLLFKILWTDWVQLGGSSAPCRVYLGLLLYEASLGGNIRGDSFTHLYLGWMVRSPGPAGMSKRLSLLCLQSQGSSLFAWPVYMAFPAAFPAGWSDFLCGSSRLPKFKSRRCQDFPDGSGVRNRLPMQGDTGSISGLRSSHMLWSN